MLNKSFSAVLLLLFICLLPAGAAEAKAGDAKLGDDVKVGSNTKVESAVNGSEQDQASYIVKILDDADLLSPEDEARILAEIAPFTAWGNALVATSPTNTFDTVQKLAVDMYDRAFGTQVGSVLLIDMQNREIFWYSEGDLYDKISPARALTIVDNVYSYASKERYADCAIAAFADATKLLEGKRISQQLKYLGNALLAFLIALFINYTIVRMTSFVRTAADEKPRRDFKSKELLVLQGTRFVKTESKKISDLRRKTFGSHGSSSYGGGSGSSGSYNSGGSSYSGSSGSSYSGSSSSSSSSSYSGSSSSSSSRSGSSSSGHRGGGAGHRF